MDIERALVSKVLAEGQQALAEVTNSGITHEFFAGATHRRVWSYIVGYNTKYGRLPTVRLLAEDNFPRYEVEEDTPEALGDLIQRVRNNHALTLWEIALNEAVKAYDDEDPEALREIISQTLNTVAKELPSVRDTDITKTMDQRWERYQDLKNLKDKDGLRGIPSGFKTVDTATQGFQPGQLVTFVGPPKAGKSTIMLLAAQHAHSKGYTPLIIGFEMSNEEQEDRLDAIAAGIPHSKLRNGSLHEADWERLRQSMADLSRAEKSFVLSNDSQSTTTLTGVAAKVEQHKPDLLIVDGVYMMQDENGEPPGTPRALTNITRGFKRLAQNLNIPIIITTQVLTWKMDKRKGITDNAIGYSSSFAQDSDVIIGVERTDDPLINKVKVVAARNCGPLEVYVTWDWGLAKFTELDDDPFATEGGDDYKVGF